MLEVEGMDLTCSSLLSPQWLSGFRRAFLPFFRLAPLVSAFPPRHLCQSPRPLARSAETADENRKVPVPEPPGADRAARPCCQRSRTKKHNRNVGPGPPVGLESGSSGDFRQAPFMRRISSAQACSKCALDLRFVTC